MYTTYISPIYTSSIPPFSTCALYVGFFSEGLISKTNILHKTYSFFKAAPRNYIVVDSGGLCGPKQYEQQHLVSEHLDPANVCICFESK